VILQAIETAGYVPARDVYLALAELWDVRVFANIARSEQTHMDAVATLIDRYGLEDPVGAVRVWSQDPSLRARATLITGQSVTALDLQRRFLDQATRFVERGGCDGVVPDAPEIIRRWSEVLSDLENLRLEKLAPHAPTSQYRHNDTGEDNADAHLKTQVMGREVVAAVTNGKLDFVTWEQFFYGEFDGRRRKRVLVKIIGE
jgi:hypothetical protein